MYLTCMSRSYEYKSISMGYSVIFAFVTENDRCFCNVQRPRAHSLLTANESMLLQTTATDILRMLNGNTKRL